MVKTDWILGKAFDIRSPHHDSIKALWETKWRFPVKNSKSCGVNLFGMAGCVCLIPPYSAKRACTHFMTVKSKISRKCLTI